MFKFFTTKEYLLWAWAGALAIIGSLWYQVQVNVKINEWFGSFYDTIQMMLTTPGSVDSSVYWGLMWEFGWIAGVFIIVAVLTDFFTQHWLFRWRQSMNEYYTNSWDKLRSIEGASQRVQEDTKRFASLVETLGVGFVRAVMTLIAFVPILWGLSKAITIVPIFGAVPHALVFGAIGFALIGTVGLALLGVKLPGLEYNNQVVEASYRKELVHGEDNDLFMHPSRVKILWSDIRKNYFKLYFHYMYFGIGKWSYLQFGVLVPYILMGPTLIGGLITFGVMQQTVRAFGQVESSLQYLVSNWTVIVELISVHKRLRAFEGKLSGK